MKSARNSYRFTLSAICAGAMLCLLSCNDQTLEKESSIKCQSSDPDACKTTKDSETEEETARKSFDPVEQALDPAIETRWIYDKDDDYVGLQVSASAGFALGAVSISVQLTRLEDLSGYSLKISGSKELSKAIDVNFPFAILEGKTSAQRESMRYVFQAASGASWIVPLEKLLRNDSEGVVGMVLDEWGVVVITDPVRVPTTSELSGIGSQTQNGDPHLPGNPQLSLSGLPSAIAMGPTLNITVGGTDIHQYKFQILDGDVACSAALSLSGWITKSQKITLSAGADGKKTLCVKGRSEDLTEQQTFVRHIWVVDQYAPTAPGIPTAFSIDVADFNKAQLTWASAPSDSGSGLSKQEVLIFANDNDSCSGTPDAVVQVANSATTLSWDRKASGLFSVLRFSVRAEDVAGRSSTSICSGEVKLFNGLGLIYPEGNNYDLGRVSNSINMVADLTGDGIDDLIYGDSSYKSNRGYIAVLPGGATGFNEGFRIYEGETSLSLVGYPGKVSVRDINGDGYNDLISTYSTTNVNGVSEAGSIYIVLGGSTLAASGPIGTAGRRYDGSREKEKIGYEIYYADVTGDGADDIVTAYPNSLITYLGAVGVIPGGSLLPASGSVETVGRSYTGVQAFYNVGSNLEFIDVSGDGVKDILIPETYISERSLSVLIGGWPLPASASLGTAGKRYTSGSTATTKQHQLMYGDVTGDGVKDIVFSNIGVSDSDKGKITIIKGGALPASGDVDSVYWRRYTGNASDFLSTSGSYLADVNCDGIEDMIAGGSGYNSGAGRVYVMLGSASLAASGVFTSSGGLTFAGTYAGEGVGYNLLARDINGDNCKDILFSNHLASPNAVSSAGTLGFILGNASFPTSGNFRVKGRVIEGVNANEGTSILARSFEMAEDFDGDSIKDITFGYQSNARNGANAGALYFIPGTSSGSGTITALGAVEILGTGANDRFGPINYGYPTTTRKDLTKDGVKEIIIPSGSAESGKGVITVLEAGSTPTAGNTITVAHRYIGDNATDGIGTYGIYYEDINNDTYKDIITYGGGSIYIVLGGATLPASGAIGTVGIRINSTVTGMTLGNGFSLVDMNGDGRKDIVSYHKDADGNGTDSGALVIIPTPTSWTPGTKTLTDVSAKIFHGSGAGVNFGDKVLIEDFDGDGLKDIAIRTGSAATSHEVALIKGNSNFASIARQSIYTSASSLGAMLVAGDFDSDGIKDLFFGTGTASFGGFSFNSGVYIYNHLFSP